MSETLAVKERDKPFFLLLIMLGCFMGVFAYALIIREFELLKDMVTWFSPWISMAWAWYFKEKIAT